MQARDGQRLSGRILPNIRKIETGVRTAAGHSAMKILRLFRMAMPDAAGAMRAEKTAKKIAIAMRMIAGNFSLLNSRFWASPNTRALRPAILFRIRRAFFIFLCVGYKQGEPA